MTAHLRIRDVPRERDDEVLEWIRLHEAGWSWAQIGRHSGATKRAVQQAVLAVVAVMDPPEQPIPRQKGGRPKAGVIRPPSKPVRLCMVPGCYSILTDANRTGVCRSHNHHFDHCGCQKCVERRAR